MPQQRRFSLAPPLHGPAQQKRRRSLPDAHQVDLLAAELGQNHGVDALLKLPDMPVSNVPSRTPSRQATPDEETGGRRPHGNVPRRPSKAPRPEFAAPDLPKESIGFGIVGSAGGHSIQRVQGKYTQPRRPSTSRPALSRESSPGAQDFRRKSGMGATGAEIAGLGNSTAERPALPPRPQLPPVQPVQPAPEPAPAAPVRPAPEPLDSPVGAGGGPGGLDTIASSKSGRSLDAPSDISKEASLRSLDSTLAKLEEDKSRTEKSLSLLASTARAVQVFTKSLLSPRSKAGKNGEDDKNGDSESTLPGTNSKDASDRQDLPAEGEGSDKAGMSQAATTLTGAASLASSSSLSRSQPHNMSSLLADAAASGQLNDTAGIAGAGSAGSEEEGSGLQGRFCIGDVLEHLVVGGEHDGQWVKCRVTDCTGPDSYSVQILQPDSGILRPEENFRTNVQGKYLRKVQQADDDLWKTMGSTSSQGLSGGGQSGSRFGSSDANLNKSSKVNEGKDADSDDEDALAKFMEELFAEYASTKDNKGRPLMNNMGVRRFFQDFAVDKITKVVAKADTFYADEIERQKDMNFRFDLSKAEAKRGLCFKSFCCLMDQVYPKGASRSIMRQRFKEYAGDASAMKADRS